MENKKKNNMCRHRFKNSPAALSRALRFLALVCFITCTPGLKTRAQALKVGDQMPDIEIKRVFNHTNEQLKFSEFKAKLILFDFWAPNCVSCLKSFRKLDSLQRLFRGDIQIILVNKESLDSTKRLFQMRKFLYKPELPFVTSDTVLNKLFPNAANPALAWIDGNGKYYQMTNEITADAIRKFLQDKSINLDAYRFKKKYVSSLFDKEYESAVEYHSYLSRSITGINFNGGDIGSNGIIVSNVGLLDLYFKAYEEGDRYKFKGPGRLELITKDSTQYFFPADGNQWTEWKKKNFYNYSLRLPPSKAADRFKTMQNDLARYFNIEAQVVSKPVKCLVLIRTSKKDKLETKGKDAVQTFRMASFSDPINTAERVYFNKSFHNFSAILGLWIEHKLAMPFMDQTEYSGKIDVSFKGTTVDYLTLDGLRKELNKYDLDLVEKNCLLDVLLIKEVN